MEGPLGFGYLGSMATPLDAFFRPESIAVVGTSRRPGTIGYQILDNLLRHGYQGVVYPVNPHAAAVHSIKAYPSVKAIPGPVDLAVVVVEARLPDDGCQPPPRAPAGHRSS